MKLPGKDALRERLAARKSAPQGARYASSPLLAAKTPIWRSRLLVVGVGLTFCLLIGRAVYIQVVNQDFFQQQGESRYQRTFELQASRGRITDRTGQVLAASVPAQSIWVIPKDFQATPAQQQALSRLLGMAPGELGSRLKENQNFVWLRRLVDDGVAAQIKALALKGVHQQREYRREYPEGEAVAHLHRLWFGGQLRRTRDAEGIWRFAPA